MVSIAPSMMGSSISVVCVFLPAWKRTESTMQIYLSYEHMQAKRRAPNDSAPWSCSGYNGASARKIITQAMSINPLPTMIASRVYPGLHTCSGSHARTRNMYCPIKKKIMDVTPKAIEAIMETPYLNGLKERNAGFSLSSFHRYSSIGFPKAGMSCVYQTKHSPFVLTMPFSSLKFVGSMRFHAYP